MCSHVIRTPPMHKLTWGRVEYCTGQVQSLRVILSVLGSSDMSTFSIHTAFCTNLTLKKTVSRPSIGHGNGCKQSVKELIFTVFPM